MKAYFGSLFISCYYWSGYFSSHSLSNAGIGIANNTNYLALTLTININTHHKILPGQLQCSETVRGTCSLLKGLWKWRSFIPKLEITLNTHPVTWPKSPMLKSFVYSNLMRTMWNPFIVSIFNGSPSIFTQP